MVFLVGGSGMDRIGRMEIDYLRRHVQAVNPQVPDDEADPDSRATP
jgi:hypothetical protein